MTPHVLELGAFRLIEPLGRGGMAVVWRAALPSHGRPVAVKLVGTLDPRAEARFGDEVRATARLSHPAVVRILDAGRAERDAGPIPAGTSWLAMELAEGTLADAGAVPDWNRLAEVLEQVLGGLAHAHARGVIHRDLKPANVLRFGARTVKLADFGLARLDDAALGARAGTPGYMAPEQIRGDERRLGPGTDLYALGCLVWELTCGAPPFTAPSARELLNAHLGQEPPALPELPGLPEGLGAWVRALLEKDPRDRPRSAAHALAALRALPPPPVPAKLPAAASRPGSESTLALDFDLPLDPPDGGAGRRETAPPVLPAHPPEDRRESPIGLGLLGVRDPLTTGRDPEKARAWEALAEALATGQPRLLLIEGGTGLGKTTLARWVATRAGEAVGAPTFGDTVGLPESIARHLGLRDGDDVATALSTTLPGASADLRAALSHLLQAPRDVLPGDRGRALAGALVALAPAVVVLDDLDEAPDDAAVVDALLDKGRGALLIVATATEAPRAFDDWEARGARRLGLGPLTGTDLSAALRTVVPLSPAAAGRVASLAAGNPAEALSLAETLVQGPGATWVGGERVPAEDAWPAPTAAPADRRLARALHDLEPDTLRALALGVLLGPAVEPDEWAACCVAAGLEVPWAAVDRLVDQRIVERSPAPRGERGRWSLRSGPHARELLARVQGAPGLAAVALRTLETRRPGDRRRLAELARASGDPERELSLWLEILRFRRDRNELARLVEEQATAAASGLPATHPAVVELGIHHAVGLALRDATARLEARDALVAASTRAGALGWPTLASEAMRQAGRSSWLYGRHAEALELLDRALAIEGTTDEERARVQWERATVLVGLGRPDEAEGPLAEADRHWRSPDRPLQTAWCTATRATLRRAQGRPDDALRLLAEAEQHYRRAGYPVGVMVCAANRGGTLADIGQLDAAMEAFDRAIEIAESGVVVAHSAYLPRLTRLQVAFRRGDPWVDDEIEALLLHPRLPPARRAQLLGWRLAARARRGALDGFDAALDELRASPWSGDLDDALAQAEALLPEALAARVAALRAERVSRPT